MVTVCTTNCSSILFWKIGVTISHIDIISNAGLVFLQNIIILYIAIYH